MSCLGVLYVNEQTAYGDRQYDAFMLCHGSCSTLVHVVPCNAMGHVVPWCMLCHGARCAMVHVVPWCMLCHGARCAMGHVVPWGMFAMGHVVPWGMLCHGARCAMVHVVPWCTLCHGARCARVHVVPWCTLCHGACCAMVHVVPWCMLCHGDILYDVSIFRRQNRCGGLRLSRSQNRRNAYIACASLLSAQTYDGDIHHARAKFPQNT